MRLFKRFTSVFALLLVVSLLAGSVESLANSTDGNRESPDAYSVTRTITGSDYPCGNFKDPQGLYVTGTETYVVDTGNNRIVHFTYQNDTFKYVDEISEYTDQQGNKVKLKTPEDCYVTKEGEVYIADTGNDKIVHLDSSRKLVKTIGRPDDQTYEQESFLPEKIVVDNSKRIFAQVKNVNKGFMEFDSQGAFTGYVGASEVTYDFLTYLWKLVATKEQ